MPKQSFFGRLWRNLANAVINNFGLGGIVQLNTSPLIAPGTSPLTPRFTSLGGGDHQAAE